MTASTDLDAAMRCADRAVDALMAQAEARALSSASVSEVLEFAQWSERLRNRLAAIDHRVVIELETKNAAEDRLMRSTAQLLASTLRITRAEARRRVEAAAVLAPHDLMTGGTQPAAHQVLAAAQATGQLSVDHVSVITRCLAEVDRLIGLGEVGPADVIDVEQRLTSQATVFDPVELSRCATRLLECLDPDGEADREESQRRRRRLSLRRVHGGMWRLTGDLLPETGVSLAAVLRPLAAPRLDNEAEGRLRESDVRTPEARLHDALDDAAHRLLRAGELPDSGGTPASVIVTIGYRDLVDRTGFGTTSDGTPLPAATVLRLADEANVIPTVLAESGGVLSLGTSRRIATRTQTFALYARDGGCSFPGCDHPPEWCDRHHVRPWSEGGGTDVDNLTLLCAYHHYRFERHGWTCRMIGGLPHWTAPPWLDSEQVPRLHERIDRARYVPAS